MKTLMRSEFIRYRETAEEVISVMRADIACDTAADIPAYNSISGIELDMGSLAWDISSGELSGLNSSHQWIKQTGGTEENSPGSGEDEPSEPSEPSEPEPPAQEPSEGGEE